MFEAAVINTPSPDQTAMQWHTQLVYPHIVHMDPPIKTRSTWWGDDHGSSANIMKSSSSAAFEPVSVNEDRNTGNASPLIEIEPTTTQLRRASLGPESITGSYRSVTRCRLGYAADVVADWFINTSAEHYPDESVEYIAEALGHAEVEHWLELLRHSENSVLADRLTYLRTPDEDDDDDDTLLTDAAILGFKDFWLEAGPGEARPSLTSVYGWLCADWTFDDGRSLVVWFKDRNETMMTAFDQERQIISHLGSDPDATSRSGVTRLSIEAGFFS